MQKDNKCPYLTRETVCTIGASVLWYLFAHGYRFANTIYSHDALLEICQNDSAWQIALGRFVQPILIFLRGGLCSPWLICFCAMIWICLGNCLLVHLLQVKHILSITLIAGIMICNPTLISANAAFLPWVDFYGLAMFLSIFGVWLCSRGGWRRLVCGTAAMALAMGIYQAYMCVSIALIVILLMRESLENSHWKAVVKKTACYGGALLLSALLYYLAWKIMLSVFDIWTADTYNGMASLGDYSELSFPALLAMTYEKVFRYFWNPDTFITMTFQGASLSILWKYLLRCANIVVVVSLIGNLAITNSKRKTKPWQWLLQAGLLLLLPAGMNFVYILSKGMEHTLMIYAFSLLYVLAVSMAEMGFPGNINGKKLRQIPVWLAVLCAIWSNAVYANQTYLKKELQERAVTSLLTRIVAEIERTEGYVPGVTPVAFSGSFENSPYLLQIVGFEELSPYGMGSTTLTYLGTDYAFLQYEISVLMNTTRIAAEEPEVMDMPTYPLPGSINYVGDILVIKISG